MSVNDPHSFVSRYKVYLIGSSPTVAKISHMSQVGKHSILVLKLHTCKFPTIQRH